MYSLNSMPIFKRNWLDQQIYISLNNAETKMDNLGIKWAIVLKFPL